MLIPKRRYVLVLSGCNTSPLSTDKQDASVANQRTAIAAYVSAHHMIVAQSYVDEGRSGLDLEGCLALQRHPG
jgi:hypothetical protein